MNEVARDFLARCFAQGSTIALLIRTESPAKTQQRVVTLDQALAPRYLGWLTHENHNGANIYVSANPLRAGSRRRTKENIDAVRHLYLDIDADGDARIAALLASEAVPSPTAILSTSPGKYQALWRVQGFNFATQEATLKLLAIVFGGDPACTDCNRVLRIPGFLNRKYDPAYRVTVEYPSALVGNLSDFRLGKLEADGPRFGRTTGLGKQTGNGSTSESDWAWVCHRLRQGDDAMRMTRELAARRCDKANPSYYAQRTVDVASARLWLVEGIPAEDITTMLQFRRRLEIPIVLNFARAREITETAQRMIGRRMIA
jgi:hypothetical protein